MLGDLFSIEKGKRLTKENMFNGPDNYLGAISSNNGVRQKITADFLWVPNCITVNYNGSVGEAFYQSEPFWASDDINILYPKNWTLNKYIGLFIATVIKLERPKYNYGRKWKLLLLSCHQKIILPILIVWNVISNLCLIVTESDCQKWSVKSYDLWYYGRNAR